MGERRELNPRMVDSQSTALIHLATSAPLKKLQKIQRFQFLPLIIIFDHSTFLWYLTYQSRSEDTRQEAENFNPFLFYNLYHFDFFNCKSQKRK